MMLEQDEFYIFCPTGGAKASKSDTLANFGVPLANQLFVTSTYEVALKEISFPQKIQNVNTIDDMNLLKIKMSGQPFFLDVHIPVDSYSSMGVLVRTINAAIGSSGVLTTTDLEFTYTADENRVTAVSKATNVPTFKVHDRLGAILGFNGDHEYSGASVPAPEHSRLEGDLSLLFIYSSVVDSSIVGEKLARLLRVVPYRPAFDNSNDQVVVTFHDPVYLPCLSQQSNTINFTLTDVTGSPFPFENRGQIFITLSFRRKRYS